MISSLTLSLPSVFNRYMGRNSLFFISKCSGDIMISYAEVYENSCTRMEFTKMFVMALDFAAAKITIKRVQGNDIRTH